MEPIAIRSQKPVVRQEWFVDFVVTPIVLLAFVELIISGLEHLVEMFTGWPVVISWIISLFLAVLAWVVIARELQKKQKRGKR